MHISTLYCMYKRGVGLSAREHIDLDAYNESRRGRDRGVYARAKGRGKNRTGQNDE